ncbi:hypothetical protein AAG570_005587 [Ranatra chinensis]|uniref:Sulfatase N-terminal domain-containing protein n=1 Tax=Ranatra chinensis TaxID=642074 RepID=A0ABD0XXV9_9HEMI
MRRNLSSDWSSVGRYATHLFDEEFQSIIKSHDVSQPLFLYLAHLAVHAGNYETPLQATVSTIDRFKHILPLEKRLYAGMLWELDQSVGRLMKSLKDKGILDNTIIVFLSDNGAATQGLHKNTGSNWPLKGEKATPWEGALRTVSFVWSRSLKQRRKVLNNMMHISDWLPTLYTAAGGEIENLGAIDGLNQWDYLNGSPCQPRREILHNIDSIFGYSAIRIGKYKYVNGSSLLGFLDTWSGEPDGTRTFYNTSLVLDSQVNTLIGDLTEDDILTSRKKATVKCPDTSTVVCRPLREPCLFDLEADPCERRNLYQKRRQFSKEFEKRIAEFRGVASPPLNKPEEPEADPARFNGTWTNWRDYP